MKNKEFYRLCFSMAAEPEASEDVELMVYSEISSDKWWGDESTPADFDKALKDAKKAGAKNLNLRVNSPGGDVWSAVAMRSMIINAGFETVRVMIEGLCASAATLFATIPGAHVVIASGSEFMIHNPSTFAWGTAADLEKVADNLHGMENQFQDMYAIRTGQDKEQIAEWMDAETWFSAKEAVDNGFCDELLEAEQIAACVSMRDMEFMREIYKTVPDGVKVRAEPQDAAKDEISNGVPTGAPTEINTKEENPMELTNLTLDQLREGAPALFEQVQASAVEAERARLEDIDALTVPGYEELAATAKANGTSALDFQRQIVAAMKQKGASFLEARKAETAPAAEVAGGTPTDHEKDEAQEIQDIAKDIAKYASTYNGRSDGMF